MEDGTGVIVGEKVGAGDCVRVGWGEIVGFFEIVGVAVGAAVRFPVGADVPFIVGANVPFIVGASVPLMTDGAWVSFPICIKVGAAVPLITEGTGVGAVPGGSVTCARQTSAWLNSSQVVRQSFAPATKH